MQPFLFHDQDIPLELLSLNNKSPLLNLTVFFATHD